MKNVKTKTEGSTLTITIDLSKAQGPSKSGKSVMIATSSGNKEFAPGLFIGLNVYRKT